MEKTQREFLLRQQIAAIRKELGESGDDDDVVDEYRAKLAELVLPDDVRDAIEREVDRLERTSEQSPEHGWIRTWLDTVLELPWGKRSDESLDVVDAREILDADHTGLDDVKDRIVEYLAVRKLRAERGHERQRRAQRAAAARARSSRWSALRASARRRWVSRSHARSGASSCASPSAVCATRPRSVVTGAPTSGARPGRIVRALTEAGTMNPVILLDEVDKLGADWRGDPSSALLEVLDPAQNHTFRDHYLEVDLDLSDVLFLATANVLDTIPGPLLDRMEIVRLDGYTEDEKVAIARDHLLARQLERNGLTADDVSRHRRRAARRRRRLHA